MILFANLEVIYQQVVQNAILECWNEPKRLLILSSAATVANSDLYHAERSTQHSGNLHDYSRLGSLACKYRKKGVRSGKPIVYDIKLSWSVCRQNEENLDFLKLLQVYREKLSYISYTSLDFPVNLGKKPYRH